MPRTPEAQAFFHAVYSAVQEIPPGKVTSYGHIAKLVGTRECPADKRHHDLLLLILILIIPNPAAQRPRQVGVCLKHLPSSTDDPSTRFHHDNVPWQRVINAKGIVSPRLVSTISSVRSSPTLSMQIPTLGRAQPGSGARGRGRDGHDGRARRVDGGLCPVWLVSAHPAFGGGARGRAL